MKRVLLSAVVLFSLILILPLISAQQIKITPVDIAIKAGESVSITITDSNAELVREAEFHDSNDAKIASVDLCIESTCKETSVVYNIPSTWQPGVYTLVYYNNHHELNADGSWTKGWETSDPFTVVECDNDMQCPSKKACVNNLCEACEPKTCAQLGKECGMQYETCIKGTIDCGNICDDGKECNTTTGQCEAKAAACTPKTCSEMGKSCGIWVEDRCGTTLDCTALVGCAGKTCNDEGQCITAEVKETFSYECKNLKETICKWTADDYAEPKKVYTSDWVKDTLTCPGCRSGFDEKNCETVNCPNCATCEKCNGRCGRWAIVCKAKEALCYTGCTAKRAACLTIRAGCGTLNGAYKKARSVCEVTQAERNRYTEAELECGTSCPSEEYTFAGADICLGGGILHPNTRKTLCYQVKTGEGASCAAGETLEKTTFYNPREGKETEEPTSSTQCMEECNLPECDPCRTGEQPASSHKCTKTMALTLGTTHSFTLDTKCDCLFPEAVECEGGGCTYHYIGADCEKGTFVKNGYWNLIDEVFSETQDKYDDSDCDTNPTCPAGELNGVTVYGVFESEECYNCGPDGDSDGVPDLIDDCLKEGKRAPTFMVDDDGCPINCTNTADCNDNYGCTEDQCWNAGTSSSNCRHPPITSCSGNTKDGCCLSKCNGDNDKDCTIGCGKQGCETGENQCNCPADCGACSGDAPEICKEYACDSSNACVAVTKQNCCGNTQCETGENCSSCAADCGCTGAYTCIKGICCNAPSWINVGCGKGGCGSRLMYQTRSCTPAGCDAESRCVTNSSCEICTCTAWTDAGCGNGGCYPDLMHQTRRCTLPSGATCDLEEQCVVKDSCPWTKTGNLEGATDVYSIILDKESGGQYLYAGTGDSNGDVFREYAGPSSIWTNTGDLSGAKIVHSILQPDYYTFYAGTGYPNGDVFKLSTYTGGTTWTSTGNLEGANAVYSIINVGSVVYAGTGDSNGDVFKSVDGGTKWTNTGNLAGVISVYSLLKASDGAIYAGVSTPIVPGNPGGKVFKSTDNGTTWAETGYLLSARDIRSLMEAKDRTLYAGTSPNGDLFKSTDKGASWTNTGDLSGASSVNSIIQASDGALYAGVSYGGNVFKSTDKGASWTNTGNLEGANIVYSLASTDWEIYAGTDIGVFRRYIKW